MSRPGCKNIDGLCLKSKNFKKSKSLLCPSWPMRAGILDTKMQTKKSLWPAGWPCTHGNRSFQHGLCWGGFRRKMIIIFQPAGVGETLSWRWEELIYTIYLKNLAQLCCSADNYGVLPPSSWASPTGLPRPLSDHQQERLCLQNGANSTCLSPNAFKPIPTARMKHKPDWNPVPLLWLC